VRADQPGALGEIVNGIDQLGLARVGMDVEDIDLAVVQAAGPEEAAVVGKAGMVGLALPAHRHLRHHLAEFRRLWIDVERDELVGAVAHAFDAQRPHVQVVLLPLDQVREIGRVACLVRKGVWDAEAEQDSGKGCGKRCTRESIRKHLSSPVR
jgi:hypothetical protein